jgi:hypothetical protein
MEGNIFTDMDLSKYKIYFYSEPHFLVLNKEDVIDVNLTTTKKGVKKIEIKYLHNSFFELNLQHCEHKDWSITIQIYDEFDICKSQIDLYGENIKLSKYKNFKILKLEYQQITNSNGWISIAKAFIDAEIVYEKAKLSYNRNSTINKLLM